MQQWLLTILATAACLGSARPLHAQALDRAAWLGGCWAGASGDRGAEERWSPPRGGTMISAARAFRGDRTTSIELVVLRERGDTLIYEAHPVGQATASFPERYPRDTAALVFENLAHDFPQRIVYQRIGADSLLAYVEGPADGVMRRTDYRMRRVRCEP